MLHFVRLDEVEIDILMQVLTDWDRMAVTDGLLTAIIGAVSSSNQEEGRAAFQKALAEASEVEAGRSDTVTLLKAKLIQMKRQLIAEAAGEELRGT